MIRKLFRQMSLTQILSAMTSTLCLLIDSIVIGRLVGVDAMSAYGIATPLLIIFAALGTLLTNGVQVVLGKTMGRGDAEGTNTCYSTSVALSLGLGALWLLLVWTLGGPLCTLLGAGSPGPENAVFAMTRDYLRGYMLGAPFFFLSQIMASYLQASGKRKLLLASVIAMSVTDVVFDLLGVFVFRAGMFGIGLASGLSYLAAFAVGLVFFLKKDCPFRLWKNGLRLRDALQIIRAGSPVLVNQVCFTLRVYILNQILLHLDGGGNTAVAVFAVFSSLLNLLYSVAFGAGSVTLMLSSIFYSDEDRRSLRALVRTMFGFPLLLVTGGVLLTELAAPCLIRLFLGSDPGVLSMAIPGLRLFVLAVIPSVAASIFKSYFQGIRHTGITNLIPFLEHLVLTVPCVWLLSRLFGLTGFWIGSTVGLTLTLLAISILVWCKHGRIAFTDKAFSYLDPDFGASPENCMELSIPDREGAVAASQQLCDFCRDKGLPRRTSMLIGLSVEEMTINIINHGFSMDRHSHNVEVRLVVEPDKRILRIRDNCASFNPTKYLALHRDDDPTAHIGLRMVMGMVKEANYVNTLGLNNLTLVI